MVFVGAAVALQFSWRFRRIEVDAKGLRLRPVLPLLRTQYVPFSSLGAFTPGHRGYRANQDPVAQAPLLDRSVYRWAGLLPARYLVIPPRYRISGSPDVLPVDQLVAALEQFRTEGAAILG